jgi:hypothetical protein
LYLGSTSTTIGTGTGVRINWVTTIGSTPGNVLAVTNATASVTNLCELLNDPYGTSYAGMIVFVRANLSIAQQRILDNISAVDGGDGSAVITINGGGTREVSTDESGSVLDRKAVHAIFGTSQSVAVLMQRTPEMNVSAGNIIGNGSTGGYVAQDFVTWTLYGQKVFLSQTKQIVNVPIACSTFTAPNQTLN